MRIRLITIIMYYVLVLAIIILQAESAAGMGPRWLIVAVIAAGPVMAEVTHRIHAAIGGNGNGNDKDKDEDKDKDDK